MDHIICSFDFCSLASDVVILDKLPSSEHLPDCCRIRFELVFDIESPDSCDSDVKFNPTNYHWCKASDAEIEQYRIGSHIHLKSISVPSGVRCSDNTCTCEDHRRKIDQYFGNICEALQKQAWVLFQRANLDIQVNLLLLDIMNMSKSYMTMTEEVI